MSRAFTHLTYTDAVAAMQERYGSRERNQRLQQGADLRDQLGERETQFIASIDTLFMATRSQSGWPYVQHRGGPSGFVRVIDANTLGFADFRGNQQYLSVGNLQADDRVMLILMDFAHQRRLKIWGRARVVHGQDDRTAVTRLFPQDYSAQPDRAMLIAVEAFDWNCSQHITQRFSLTELAPLQNRLEALTEENRRLRAALAAAGVPLPNLAESSGDL